MTETAPMMSLDLVERLTLALGLISGIVSVAIWLVRGKHAVERQLDAIDTKLAHIHADIKKML